jgi:hypothetical protein
MTISKRDAKLLLCLLGIGIFLLFYLAVYGNLNSQAEKVRADTAALMPELTELRGYNTNRETYQKGIDDAKALISELSVRYPNDVRAEDKIMFASALEQQVGLHISDASFSDPVLLLEFPTVQENGDSHVTVPLSAYSSGMSISCTMTYPELKAAINYVYSQGYVQSLDSVSVSFDSATGELYGSMSILKYYITGADSTYHPTEVPDFPTGTNNIFSSITTAPATPAQP